MKILIIGNGVAGISVAKELRARHADPASLDLEVLARESYDYYSRIRLPEVFGGGEASAELLALFKPGWYAERSIRVRLGCDVAAIDRARRTLILSTGEELGYDRLVLALGADPVRPALPGAYLPGVHTVREYDDASRVRASAEAHPEAAVVVGGGLLGLEAARHLQQFGVKAVTVLEAAPRLLPRQLDAPGAAVLEAALRELGIATVAGARLAAFEGAARVEAVRLEDGRRFEAGSVVVSMGVRPRTGLAKAAGLACGRGIVVDRFLRTSDPAISAVGDCAEFEGVSWGIIPVALDEAAPCAAALLGDESRPYSGTIPKNSLKVAGVELSSFGAAAEPPAGAEVFRAASGPGRYEAYCLHEGRLSGAIVLGSKEKARRVQGLVGGPADRAFVESLLAP